MLAIIPWHWDAQSPAAAPAAVAPLRISFPIVGRSAPAMITFGFHIATAFCTTTTITIVVVGIRPRPHIHGIGHRGPPFILWTVANPRAPYIISEKNEVKKT